ncbi:MAG: hypothetical protein WC998_09280 [Candidatus Paceibacterota bacterium]
MRKTLEIPLPKEGRFTVPMDAPGGRVVFADCANWNEVMELVAAYRTRGHVTGEVPVANDRGDVVWISLS